MKHAVALLTFLVASVCASRTAGPKNQILKGYIENLTRGLPDKDTIKRLQKELAKLEPGKVKMLHSACCKGGECAEGAAAFLVEQCSSFTEKVGVDECAWQLPSYFTTYAKSRDDVPDALKYPAVTPSDAAFLKGLGLWYRDTDYNADIEKSLKEALSYVILSDGSAENSEIRAKILLGSTEKKDSKVLLEYWKAQDASRQLAVYRNLSTGGYSDLAVLQPAIFNMDCIQSRTCNDEDYSTAFNAHIASLDVRHHVLYEPISRLQNRPLPEIADILRKVTGKRPMKADEARAIMAREFVLTSKSLQDLGTLVYQATNPGFYVPESYPDYLILDASKIETLEALDHQILDLISDRESFLGPIPFFPLPTVAKDITKRYNTIKQYGELYIGVVHDIVETVFRVSSEDWITILPSPTEDFDEAAFWDLIAFLEEERYQRYKGIFGQLLLVQHEFPEEFGELVPGGLKALMQKVAEHTGEAQLHEELDDIALRVFELRLPDHPFSEDRSEAARQQLKKGLFEAFEAQEDVQMPLNRLIMSAQAETGGSDGLYELQVDTLAQALNIIRDDPTRDSEEWKAKLKGYSSRQLENIYKSDSLVLTTLNQAQLCEKFDFTSPIKRNQVFQELSKLYQRAFPRRESVLGKMLEYLGTDSAEICLGIPESGLLDSFNELPENQDFSLTGDDSPWRVVDTTWYGKLKKSTRLGMMRRLYPELAGIQLDGAAANQCETFDELLKVMTPNDEAANEIP